MMKADCQKAYKVYVNDVLVYKCLGHTKLWNFCKEKFNISRTIVSKILNNDYKPTFNKHKFLENIKIITIYRFKSIIIFISIIKYKYNTIKRNIIIHSK